MWHQLENWEQFGFIVLLIGSIVDIFQFIWIIKRGYKTFMDSMYERAKREVLYREGVTHSKGRSEHDTSHS